MPQTKKQRWLLVLIVNVAPLIVFLLWWTYAQIFKGTRLTDCPFFEVTGLYCAGCGGTRAVKALLHLRLADAFRYHPFIPLGAILFAIYDVALVVTVARNSKFPKLLSNWIIWIYLIAWLVFAITRNILLVFGIDMLSR